jgi:hypothetical protein
VIDGHRSGEADEGRLGGVVCRVTPVGHHRSGQRSDGDDPAEPLGQHRFQRRAGDEERGVEIAGERCAPHLIGGFPDRGLLLAAARGDHAGVVDQGVEPATPGQRLLDESGCLVGTAQVADETGGVCPGVAQFGHAVLDALSRGAHHERVCPGDGQRGGMTDSGSAAGARDDRYRVRRGLRRRHGGRSFCKTGTFDQVMRG